MIPLRLLAAGLISVAAAAPVTAQTAAPFDTLAFAALKWRNIGPLRSGRSVAVAGSVLRPNEYFAGTTGGGVMKTTNGGNTWEAVTDKYFGGTVGSIGIYQPNPDIVYVGTGESTLRGNTSYGDGVYKTTDGGATWTSLGLKETRHISMVIVHPWNPDIVYVGALGHAHGPNPDRGVFKTLDGGKTWTKILFHGDSVGVTDLAMDPSDPNVLYAALWQVVRKPWDIVSGGPGSGLFKSTDAGEHWTEISRNKGLPQGTLGNIGISVSRANPKILWAMIEADSGGLFRSGDAGQSWQRVNKARNIHWRPFYFSRVFADPVDTGTVYLPNGTLYRSTDNGKHFAEVKPYSELWDTHVLWIAPNNRNRMAIAADQGARVSTNFGANWSSILYPTGQFYHIATTSHFPYRVCGSQQDNSGSCGPSRSDDMFDISRWYYPGGGEAGTIVTDPTRPDVTYATGGGFTRYDKGVGKFRFLTPWWEPQAKPQDVKQRWNWTTPMAMSPFDPAVLYVGSNMLWRSADRGVTWATISPDLTRHDPRTLKVAGGPVTVENTGAETYATIFAIAESPRARGLIWVGSDDGKVHLTRDGGGHWDDVTPPFPEFTRVSIIEASSHAAGAAYLAGNRNMLDDYAPYLYRTDDYGKSWTKITTGIPVDEFARVIREDPARKGLLYAGTERGVWVSFDDGGQWQRLRRNLPMVPVHDLAVKEGDLAIATHGRAFWIMDDISPLRQMAAAVTAKPAHLFDPADTYRVFWFASGLTEPIQTGENAPSGAAIYYWLKDKNQEASIDILDANGVVINTFTSRQDSVAAADSLRLEDKKRARNDSLRTAGVTDSATLAAPYVEPPSEVAPNKLSSPPRLTNVQGLNVFRWAYRHADGIAIADTSRQIHRLGGPIAVPGVYSARLRVGGVTETKRFVVKADPRVPASGAAYQARQEQAVAAFRVAAEVVKTINDLAALRTEASERLKAATGNAAVTGALIALRETLLSAAGKLARPHEPDDPDVVPDPFTTYALDEVSEFARGDMNTAPDPGERRGFAEAAARATAAVRSARQTATAAVRAANAAFQGAGMPALKATGLATGDR